MLEPNQSAILNIRLYGARRGKFKRNLLIWRGTNSPGPLRNGNKATISQYGGQAHCWNFT
jgi:hypothetical protein